MDLKIKEELAGQEKQATARGLKTAVESPRKTLEAKADN